MLRQKFFNKISIYIYTNTNKYITNTNNNFTNKIVKLNYKLYYKLIVKYEKKLKNLKKDWRITQKYFYFFINVNWEDIFLFFIFITNNTKIMITNYIHYFKIIININSYYIYNTIEDFYSVIYIKTKFNDFNKFLNFFKNFQSTNQFLVNFNFFSFLIFFQKIFFSKNFSNNFEFITISWLCFNYISVPYFYLNHWFYIQLESIIIYIKILLIKHYSKYNILVCLTKKNFVLFFKKKN